MATRLTLEERRKVAAWMEVFGSPSVVRNKFQQWFQKDPPSRLTIRRIHEKFERTGAVTNDCKGNSGRPRSIRTEDNIINVQGTMINSPKKSSTRVAMETGIARTSVLRILHLDLGMKPYHIQMVQALSDADKIARVRAAEVFLEMTNIDPNVVFFMSDEATFHVSGNVNKHNCVIWGTYNPHDRREHTRSSPKVNVWCGISKFGVLGPYFFNAQTVTGDSYLDMLQNFVVDNLPLRILTSGYFQQDGAPPHYSLAVRNYLDDTFGRRWIGRAGPLAWPARSPDLTPCDFWLWGMVKERVYATRPIDINDLKERITTVVRSIPKEMCERAMASMVKRLHKCIENEGIQVE